MQGPGAAGGGPGAPGAGAPAAGAGWGEQQVHVHLQLYLLGRRACISYLYAACRGLEQQVADLGRQVQVLLLQVQGGEGSEPVLRLTDGGEGSTVTTDDVISDRLLTFSDVQVRCLPWQPWQGQEAVCGACAKPGCR